MSPHWQFIGRVFSAGGTGLVLALIGISITISGATNAAAALILLVAAWVVGIAVVLVSEHVWQFQIKHRIAIAVVSAIALGVTMLGIAWFEMTHRPNAPPAVAVAPGDTPHEEKPVPPPPRRSNDVRSEGQQKPERRVVNVSPGHLMSLYNDVYTGGSDPAAIYIGRWIKVSGPLGTISGPSSKGTVVTFANEYHPLIFMYFDDEWLDDLAVMIPGGTQIVALCQIEGASRIDLRLRHCELLDSTK